MTSTNQAPKSTDPAGVIVFLVLLTLLGFVAYVCSSCSAPDPNRKRTKTTIIEVWDNGVQQQSKFYVSDSIINREGNCVTFVEYPWHNTTTACSQNITIQTY